MEKVCFVVLHYKDFDSTHTCVHSILNNVNYLNKQIVIVDNFSNDESTLKLTKEFSNNTNVTLLCNDENLGFARGNNVGYQYCKNSLNADFIVVLNNDTEIFQSDFVDLLINSFTETKYAVLGPDIYAINKDEHQNPLRMDLLTIKDIDGFIRMWDNFERHIRLIRFKFFIKRLVGRKIHIKLKKIFHKNIQNEPQLDPKKNIVLHGSCLVFSPVFINHSENAFNPNTFLYFEEDILAQYCANNQLKMIYNPNMKITHYEDQSTNKINNGEFEKYLFKMKHQRESVKFLIQEIIKKI